MTFEDSYRLKHRCDARRFRQAVFWRSVPPFAWPVIAVVLLCRRSFFECDERLVAFVASARSVADVRLEIHDFRREPANGRFPRRVLKLRVSSRRLLEFASEYLPRRDPRTAVLEGTEISDGRRR